MKKIVIVGAGMMGSALSVPACDKGNIVRIVGTHLDRAIIDHAKSYHKHLTMKRKLPDEISYFQIEEIEQALEEADFVICGVSSFGALWFAEKVLPLIPKGLPVLSVTKGLIEHEDGSLETFPHFWAGQASQTLSFCAIGGPCTSYELADRQQSSVVFCGKDLRALRMLRDALGTDYYHISLSGDVTGVELAAALKNAYALAVSLAIGIQHQGEQPASQLAYNPQAAVFGQSVREIQKLLLLYGGGADNIVYAAGDLYVTIFGGRTRRLGILLGEGKSIDDALFELAGVTLESVAIAQRTVGAIETLAGRGLAQRKDFPLLLHVGELLKGENRVNIPWREFEAEENLSNAE